MPKKTGNLIVRLDPDQKAAFMAACEAEGTTASEEVRGFIERFVEEHAGLPRPMKETLMTVARNPKKSGALGAGLAAAALAIGAVSGPVAAQTTPERQFAALDANADGIATLEEFTAEATDARLRSVQRREFVESDADKDGRVTREEYVARWTRQHRDLFTCLDANRDGLVRLREWTGASGVCGAYVHGYTAGMNFSRGDDMPRPDEGDEAARHARLGESFADADTNGDGRIAFEEFAD